MSNTTTAASSPRPRGLTLLLGWRRVLVTLAIATVPALMFTTVWTTSNAGLFLRVYGVALLAMLAFGVLEQWPRRTPKWLARWVLQVLAVALVVPVATAMIYGRSPHPGSHPSGRTVCG